MHLIEHFRLDRSEFVAGVRFVPDLAVTLAEDLVGNLARDGGASLPANGAAGHARGLSGQLLEKLG